MRAALLTLLLPIALVAGCGSRYSPDAYATRAVQQANKVEQGVVIGRRVVTVELGGETGAAAGAAAGGVVGSQVPGGNMAGAIGAVGGALVGGIFGSTVERTAGNTTALEYIVRKTNNELVSVTQRDEAPLGIGDRVLVIAGSQARIVRDYTAPGDPVPTAAELPPATAAAPVAPAPEAAAAPAAPGSPVSPPGGAEPSAGGPPPPLAEPLPELPASRPAGSG